jgi:hypothetical protein
MTTTYEPVTILSENAIGQIGSEEWPSLTAGMIRGRIDELSAMDWEVQEIQVGDGQESLSYDDWGPTVGDDNKNLTGLLEMQGAILEEFRSAVEYAVKQIDRIPSAKRIKRIEVRLRKVLDPQS